MQACYNSEGPHQPSQGTQGNSLYSSSSHRFPLTAHCLPEKHMNARGVIPSSKCAEYLLCASIGNAKKRQNSSSQRSSYDSREDRQHSTTSAKTEGYERTLLWRPWILSQSANAGLAGCVSKMPGKVRRNPWTSKKGTLGPHKAQKQGNVSNDRERGVVLHSFPGTYTLGISLNTVPMLFHVCPAFCLEFPSPIPFLCLDPHLFTDASPHPWADQRACLSAPSMWQLGKRTVSLLRNCTDMTPAFRKLGNPKPKT